ncbi:Hypothetical predicted protein [Olea europaea subsp. europaea]|uniref:Uncharacterized protein n=1 Tax=Olea europaea subsp. europaea TaxID=158383 RepID=A0A8S0Q548_OLEEU|nr:Hypothetical predicted protein [Olea europaea subsp. europaea]
MGSEKVNNIQAPNPLGEDFVAVALLDGGPAPPSTAIPVSSLPPSSTPLTAMDKRSWSIVISFFYRPPPIFKARLMSKIAEKKIKEADRVVSHTVAKDLFLV